MKDCLICNKKIENWDEDICSDCSGFFRMKYGEDFFRKKIEYYLDAVKQEKKQEEEMLSSIKLRRKKCRKKS